MCNSNNSANKSISCNTSNSSSKVVLVIIEILLRIVIVVRIVISHYSENLRMIVVTTIRTANSKNSNNCDAHKVTVLQR